MRTTSPTSSSLGAWQEWLCFMENYWMVSCLVLDSLLGTFSSLSCTRFELGFFHYLGFFIRPFYKMMLGKQISLKDMESVVRTQPCSYKLTKRSGNTEALIKAGEWSFTHLLVRYVCRTVNITTHWSGFWRMTPLSWTWGFVLMRTTLDRCSSPFP